MHLWSGFLIAIAHRVCRHCKRYGAEVLVVCSAGGGAPHGVCLADQIISDRQAVCFMAALGRWLHHVFCCAVITDPICCCHPLVG